MTDPAEEGPAARAARHAKVPGPRQRGYPSPSDVTGTGTAVALAATYALLGARTRAEAAAILRTAVHDLGGGVVPARLATRDCLEVDVSLGIGEPQVVHVDPVSVAAMRLAQHLPGLVQEALLAAARGDQADRQARADPGAELSIPDEVDGWLRVAKPGDVVVLIAMGDSPPAGRPGDDALRSLEPLLRGHVRGDDSCWPYEAGGLVLLLAQVPLSAARTRMEHLADAWAGDPARAASSLSIGIAAVGSSGVEDALRGAEQAVYRARRGGNSRVAQAGESST